MIEEITYDFLHDHAKLIDTAYDGTCQLWIYNGEEYVVLSDNSVITRLEDNTTDDNPIFPYKSWEIKK